MKASNTFKQTIQAFLDEEAAKDAFFAQRLQLAGKNIEDCVSYILNQVKKSGCNGFADEEIYGMAKHYYDEDNIDSKDTKAINCKVVVNHQVELTEQEKQELREKAKQEYLNQQLQAEKNAEKRKVDAEKRKREELAEKYKVVQTSLF